jgi:hypothetical protein
MLRAALAAFVVAIIATSAAAQSTGVADCDELLAKMQSCALKEPKAVQAHSKQLVALTRRQAAEMLRELGKQEAADYCRAMLHGYRTAGYSKEYGCRF